MTAMRRSLLVLMAGALWVLGSSCVFGGDDDDGAQATPTIVNQVRGASTAGAATAAPSPTSVASPTPTRPETYTVKAGDTLSEIAALFDLSTSALAEANAVADLDTLDIGQVLKIPPN